MDPAGIFAIAMTLLVVDLRVPFTTSLLGRFPSELPAELAYGANLTAIGLMHWLMWLYGTRPSLLLEPDPRSRPG
jgi:uncharacterized membrane protein